MTALERQADGSLAGVVREVRAGADAARRADRDLAVAGGALRRAGDAIDYGIQGARQEVARALELMSADPGSITDPRGTMARAADWPVPVPASSNGEDAVEYFEPWASWGAKGTS